MTRVASRDLATYALKRPSRDIETYGAMSYTNRGYGSGRMPRRIAAIFDEIVKRDKHVPTVYSYSTPIAFYDRVHDTWIVPDVSYSMTTAKHRSYLRKLSPVHIPADCGAGDEFETFASRRSIYTRGKVQAA